MKLPNDLWALLISDWLGVIELTALDAALCNREIRKQYLECLAEQGCVLPGPAIFLESTFLQWAVDRLATLNSVMVRSSDVLCLVPLGQLSNLSVLLVEHVNIEDVSLINNLLQRNTNTLAELSLPSCQCLQDLSAALAEMKKLKKVDFSFCSQQTVSSAFASLPKLEALTLASCPSICPQLLHALTKCCPLLVELDLTDSHHHLHDDDVLTLVQAYPAIRALNLNHCDRLTDSSLAAIASSCIALEQLSIAEAVHVTDDGLIALSNNTLLQLCRLDLTGCVKLTDCGVTKLLARCQQMESMKIGQCPHISNYSMIRIAECCPDMQVLDINYCYKISDTGLLALSKGCRRVVSLNLDYCQFISSSGLQLVGEHGGFADLKVLSMCCLIHINDMCVLSLTTLLEQLTDLNISGCILLTDIAVLHILTTCTRLKRLDISDNSNISDLSMEKIAGSPLRLTFLNVAYCHGISAEAMARLRTARPTIFGIATQG